MTKTIIRMMSEGQVAVRILWRKKFLAELCACVETFLKLFLFLFSEIIDEFFKILENLNVKLELVSCLAG